LWWMGLIFRCDFLVLGMHLILLFISNPISGIQVKEIRCGSSKCPYIFSRHLHKFSFEILKLVETASTFIFLCPLAIPPSLLQFPRFHSVLPSPRIFHPIFTLYFSSINVREWIKRKSKSKSEVVPLL
jgi:hypothetical protein